MNAIAVPLREALDSRITARKQIADQQWLTVAENEGAQDLTLHTADPVRFAPFKQPGTFIALLRAVSVTHVTGNRIIPL